MIKEKLEIAFLKEIAASHFYQLKYENSDKTVREYEHCRQRYLKHKKNAEYYKNMMRRVEALLT